MQDLAEEIITKSYNFILKKFGTHLEDYFENIHDYIKDLFRYKKIDLNFEFENQNDEEVEKTFILMKKIVKIGLSTIGLSQEFLDSLETEFLKYSLLVAGNDIKSYNSYFEIVLENYIKVILVLTLIQYLYDINDDWFESIDSFDLFPRDFLKELKKIKVQYQFEEDINSNELKAEIFVNPAIIQKLTTLVYGFDDTYLQEIISKKEVSLINKKYEENENNDIIAKLAEAKSKSLDILRNVELTIGDTYKRYINTLSEKNLNLIGEEELYHFDFLLFKHAPSIDHALNILNFNQKNFLKAKKIYKIKFDIEDLFHYISILAILGIQNPFEAKEILDILTTYLKGGVFGTSHKSTPPPQLMYYGISIANILKLKDVFDEINFIKLYDIVSDNLIFDDQFNFSHIYYNLLILFQIPSLNFDLIKRINKYFEDNSDILQSYEPNKDINHLFYSLSTYKILNRFKNIKNSKERILEIKEYLLGAYKEKLNLSQLAKILLCTNLMHEKEAVSTELEEIFAYIKESVKLFQNNKQQKLFDWSKDKIAFKIELRMLYWILLALIFTCPKSKY